MPKTASAAAARQRTWMTLLFVLLLVPIVGVAACAAIAPELLEILFYAVVMGLFCDDFNILGGCRESVASNLFGWTVAIVVMALFVLAIRTLYRAWRRL